MASHTIKVSGISPDLLRLLDERVRTLHATGRAEYVRELIRRDVVPAGEPPKRTYREILAPIHAETARLGYSEEEIERDIDEAVADSRRARSRSQTARKA
jgi:hypothetical protein